ncbi:MAG: PEP-CTERM sorting domain-containing protein, partial [Candidatus Rokuibacteriota bacterium]
FGDGYSSPNPTETYRLFHVSTPAAEVGNVSFSAAIFDDLGSGTSFGSVVIAPSDNGATIHIPLNGAGVTALNLAGGGELAVGGAVDLNPVPEPTTLLLVGIGAAGVGLARWVKRRSHQREQA